MHWRLKIKVRRHVKAMNFASLEGPSNWSAKILRSWFFSCCRLYTSTPQRNIRFTMDLRLRIQSQTILRTYITCLYNMTVTYWNISLLEVCVTMRLETTLVVELLDLRLWVNVFDENTTMVSITQWQTTPDCYENITPNFLWRYF